MANTLNLGDGNWATKEDLLLGYNSENNNYKPLPFDFSRASSATRVNKDGLIETVGGGEPRIDFKDDSKGALLLEPSRTNLFLNSEPTSNEGASGGITYESFNWFLGFSNCIKFGDDSSLRFRYGATVSATTQYTISAFVIMDDLSEPLVGVSSVTGDFAFVCGGITGGVANENIYYGNNIYRVSTTLTSGTNANNSGIIKYTSQSSKGFRVVGLQIEQGSYATSYIPTQGSAVTRLADTCDNGANEQVINSTEGVLYFEALFGQQESTSRYISINDESSSNRVLIGVSGGTNILRGFVFSGSVQQAQIIDTVDLSETLKLAISYKQNEIKFFKNGFQVSSTVTSAITPVGLSVLDFDDSMNAKFYGNVKEIKLYNTALTDAELQALTTI